MTLPVIVLGGGGHAKVLIDTLYSMSVPVLGVVDPDAGKHDQLILGVPVIGNDDFISNYSPTDIQLVNGLGSTKTTAKRRQIYDKFKNLGYTFASVIHSAAIVSEYVNKSAGIQVLAGAVIQPGVSLGENTIINTKASVDHDCNIGSHVHLAPGVTISGEVKIEDGTHVGTGAVIIQGVKIGQGCLIGAGAVILSDVPSGKTVVGLYK